MAKLSPDERRAVIAQREAVQQIRRRYAEALRMGYSTEEAAELAHNKDEINPVGVTSRSGTNPLPNAQKATVHGGGQAPNGSDLHDNIPPNWKELPWPQLKSLAESLSGNKDVKSRKQADDIIGGALAAHSV